MAKNHYTRNENGLVLPWNGRVWLNPPYGRHTFDWLERLAEHGSGLALIFARTETTGFHAQVWNKAHAVFFFRGRLCFHYVTGEKGGPANAPSYIVAYSEADTESVVVAASAGKFNGKLVILKQSSEIGE